MNKRNHGQICHRYCDLANLGLMLRVSLFDCVSPNKKDENCDNWLD